MIKLFHQKRIIKYTHWTIRYANINTTSNARVEKYKNFYDVTNELIEELGENETLVLADLYDDEESISKTSSKRRKKNVFKGTVTHRGQRGSNTFKNIKNFINACYLYEGESSYILEYLYYNRNAEIKNWSSVICYIQDEEIVISVVDFEHGGGLSNPRIREVDDSGDIENILKELIEKFSE